VNYHKYGLPDAVGDDKTRLGRFHADIGNRPSRNFLEANDRCASTNDWDVAPQFLFEDALQDRSPIGGTGYFVERLRMTGRAASNQTATASEVYREFSELSTKLFPYRKQPNRMSCQSFIVSVPANSLFMDIMIVDADDARPANAGLVFMPTLTSDPQRKWRFQWKN